MPQQYTINGGHAYRRVPVLGGVPLLRRSSDPLRDDR